MTPPELSEVAMRTVVALLATSTVLGMLRWTGRPVRHRSIAVLVFLAAAGIASVRLRGLTPAGWFAGLVPSLSVPTLALLLHASLRMTGGAGLFRGRDLRAVGFFGLVMGLILYPAAMGWGSWDPYASGWGGRWFLVSLGLFSALMVLVGSRLGWILIAAVLAWRCHLWESENYWDYLVDPFLAVAGWILIFAEVRRGPARAAAESPLES